MIPAALMKQQITNDHTPPNRGKLDSGSFEDIEYGMYARSPEGTGKYLSEAAHIQKYRGTSGNGGSSGTLPTTYKARWRTETKGIPALVREALKHESTSAQPGQRLESEDLAEFSASDQIPQLPDYLTLDIAWLCICLYAHIAECNHDTTATKKLRQLQELIPHPADVVPPSADGVGTGESIVRPWPLTDPADRTRLLLRHLHPSDHPERSQPNSLAAIEQHVSTPST